MTIGPKHTRGPRSFTARLFAVFLTSILALAGFVGAAAPAAYAETPGISTTVLHNGSPIQDGALVETGDVLTVNTQYSVNTPDGAAVMIGIPEGVTVDESSLEVPAGNEAIEGISLVDGGIQIQFADPMPDIQDGMHSLDFIFDEVEHTESRTLEWQVDGETVNWDIIVIEDGAEQENVQNQLSKSVHDLDLNRFVTVDQGVVSVDSDILNESFDYTLTVNTDRETERTNFTIDDEISPYLTYDEDSFDASLTTWDDIGWNSTTESFNFDPQVSDNGFTYSGDLPNPSELTVTYSASIPEGQLQALTTQIQTQYDELGGPGDYTVGLNNEVTFGDGSTSEANVNVGGTREEGDGPAEVEDYLNKSAGNADLDQFVDFNSSGQVTVDEGILDHEITYTLNVNTADEAGREGFSFEDELSEYLSYDQDSFEGFITTWDENGWNEETNPFAFDPEFSGNGFAFTGDIEGPSELTITYTASVDPDQLESLTAALQAEFDNLGTDSGDYRVALNNTITFGGDTERDADVSVGGHRADGEGPENVSDYLNKSVGDADLSQYVDVYEDEVTVNEAILDLPIDYTLNGMPPEVGPHVMRAAVPSMGTDFSILSRAAVPER